MARHVRRTSQLELSSVNAEELASVDLRVSDREFNETFDAFALKHEFCMDESDFETLSGAHRSF